MFRTTIQSPSIPSNPPVQKPSLNKQLGQIIQSEHNQSITYICLNQMKNRLITCGEDGEIHYYAISIYGKNQQKDNTQQQQIQEQKEENQNKEPYWMVKQAKKMGYYAVFQEPITYADWGTGFARAYVVVGSAKGNITILRINPENGAIFKQSTFQLGANSGILDIKWATKKRAFLVSTTKSKIAEIHYQNQQWSIRVQLQFSGPTYMAYYPGNQQYLVMSRINGLCFFKIQQQAKNTNFKKFDPFIKLDDENDKISRIVWSNQLPVQFNSLIVLTRKYILVFSTPETIQNMQLKLVQKIQLKNENSIQYISWGIDQTQLICYSSRAHQNLKKEKLTENIENFLAVPKKLVLNLMGEWQWSKKAK